MPTYRFKTNLKCGGCVQSVRPFLDSIANIREWAVDLNSPDRILTVETVEEGETSILNAVAAAGYKVEYL